MFGTYLRLGFDHILDFNGYDHILFVMTLCAVYTYREWKQILILVTAFTIGHSLTLGLAVFNIVNVSPSLSEKLIPITILLTAVFNLIRKEEHDKSMYVFYFAACFFGLIHGLGFSNYLKALIGDEESLLMPLLGFNIGVELGQICIVLASLLLSFISVNILKIQFNVWKKIISGIAITIALYLIFK